MCASYTLDPVFEIDEWIDSVIFEVRDALRAWAEANAGATILPTGIRARNLNPIVRREGVVELAWWGYLENGTSAKYPSINSRAERLATHTAALPARAIVPASYWREFQKPSKTLHHLGDDGSLLGLAAVTRPGRTADGAEFICYSLIMQPAAPQIAHIHDRMPLLIAPGFADEWLHSDAPAGMLLDAATVTSRALAERITARPQSSPPSTDTLF